MDDILYVILPNKNINSILNKMIQYISNKFVIKIVRDIDDIDNYKNKKLLFAAEASFIGYDIAIISFLDKLAYKDKAAFQNSTGGLFISSSDDEGTKRMAQDIIYIANNMGCTFVGHPLVEATNSLRNFMTWQKTMTMPLMDICLLKCGELAERLIDDKNLSIENPSIIVIYAVPHSSSNSLNLWHMVSKYMAADLNLREIELKNRDIHDCIGCPYKLCTHFGMAKGCFYGGYITENILPAIEESDAIVWLCPNYNDSLSANLTAVINRLTVLYRRIKFYDKSIFAVIVSGNSGSDSVAKQLIGSLNINKGFRLPPYFSIRKIANDPDAIFNVDNIENDAKKFAGIINNSIKRGDSAK